MIHAFRWNRDASIRLTDVPHGTYAVYLYVWEETGPTTFDISLEGKNVVGGYNSGMAGDWRRLGPWTVQVTDGSIDLRARGGDTNLSGIEVWRRTARQR